jgi:hypothetical protein
MRRLLPLFLSSGALVFGADLATVRTVYLMPMPRALDQYLASRLTSEHIFQVVADPKLADAIFTDRLGEGFMLKLEEISPTPKPPAPEAKPQDQDQNGAKPAAKTSREHVDKPASKNSTLVSALGNETANKADSPAMNSTFGRGKGTVFLVDAKTRLVVWSIFDPSKLGADNHDLDRTANDIVSRLRKDLNPDRKKK